MGNQPDLDPQKSTLGKEPEETEPVWPQKFWPLPRFKMGLGRGMLDFNHLVILMGFQQKWWYKMGVGRWGW